MTLNVGSMVIELMDSGIYTFYEDSATGKTYLRTKLEAYGTLHEGDILTITYRDGMDTMLPKYIELIRNNNYKIIFVDRADMYLCQELVDALNDSEALVLVDVKNPNKALNLKSKYCDIEFDLEGFKVYD